ncbi:C4-dicarboxylate transport system large permease [Bacillus freudenreichii]|nr:C4-dicarboxylate transport system large permease [Bacillus freudenreichii]
MTIAVLFGTLFLLIFLSVPIGISIGVATLITIMFTADNINLGTIAQKSFTSLDSFPLMAIPFFTLAGILMGKGGISKRLLDFAGSLVGFMTGGLAMVTVLACMFFAAISGSGPATVAAIGSFMIPAMQAKKYGDGFSPALTASAGSIGVVIPPSIPFVLLGVTGSLSISDLFMAGVFPGILIGVLLMITSFIIISLKKIDNEKERMQVKRVWETFYKAIWALLTPIIVLGGIYAGIFTPTEAAAVAIVYGLIVGVFVYRELKLKDIYDSIVETVKITGATLYMVGLSIAFAYLLTIERIPSKIAEGIMGASDNPIIVLLLINLFLLVVGAFIDTIAAIVILTPILLPVAVQIGVDPIHFGVIMVVNLAIGFITPPVGVNLFVASAVGKVPFDTVAKGIVPLFITMLVALAIITYVPQLSMWLPNLMK